jgi:UDP-GlcNAc:undecaprenyl-phosphate GlcNAc-1-phosphate transferase
MGDTGGYLIVGFFAMFVTLVTTPLVRRFARHHNWVAMPSERKVHKVPTPDVGGIALFAGVVAALLLAWNMDRFSPLFNGNSEPRGVLLGAFVMLVVGTRDDVKEVSAPARVLATVGAAMVLVWFGVTMFYFRVPFFRPST